MKIHSWSSSKSNSVQCNSDSIKYSRKVSEYISSKGSILDGKLDVSTIHKFTFWASLRHYSVNYPISKVYFRSHAWNFSLMIYVEGRIFHTYSKMRILKFWKIIRIQNLSMAVKGSVGLL